MNYSYTTLLVNLLATTNAAGNAAIFLALTAERSTEQQQRICLRMGLSLLVIFTLTIWAGPPLLHALGISIPAFEAAGGLIVLLIGLNMLQGPSSHPSAEQGGSLAIVPLSIPLIAGPGALSVLLIHSHHLPSLVLTTGIAWSVGAFTTAVFWIAPQLVKHLGHQTLDVIARVMGLLLASMGCGMLAHGARMLLGS